MIKYITRRPLWFNILTAVLLIIIIFLVFMLSLKWITKHGDSKTVPSVIGKNINDVIKTLDDDGFEVVIQDSSYDEALAPGIVVKQIPAADQVVKSNRTVYVVINRFVPPNMPVPNIIGFSFRNAEMTLNNQRFRLGDTTYRPDFAKNSVLEILYNGQPIKPGDKLKVGSKIDLVLGSGLGTEDMSVPKLVGLTLAEARIMLEQLGLVLGSSIGDVPDKENAYIYRQDPAPRTVDGIRVRIRPGQMIDVWLQQEPVAIDSSQDDSRETPEQ
ncbi:MAG: PASTA domain-containing protein [Flavisolibacter sp.]